MVRNGANGEETSNIRGPKVEIHWNRWLTYGCEVRDVDFWKDIWVSEQMAKKPKKFKVLKSKYIEIGD